jgi:LysM repeat protein
VYFNPIVYNKLKEDKMMSQSSKIYHKVRSGETLGGIAMKYRVKLASIYRWNGLSSKSIIRPGQKIVIYRNGAGPSSSSSKGSAQTTTSGGYTYYTVKKGDTLSGIAYRCGVSLNTILKLNGLSKTSKIYPGKKLKVKKN